MHNRTAFAKAPNEGTEIEHHCGDDLVLTVTNAMKRNYKVARAVLVPSDESSRIIGISTSCPAKSSSHGMTSFGKILIILRCNLQIYNKIVSDGLYILTGNACADKTAWVSFLRVNWSCFAMG